MLKKALSTIVFLGNALLFGQTGSIKGKIFDSENKEGLPFAVLQLEQKGVMITKTVADIDGDFNMKDLVPGTYDIKGSYVGYGQIGLSGIVVDADKVESEIINAAPVPLILNTIDIIGFEEPLVETEIIYCCFLSSDESFNAETIDSDSVNAEEKVKPLEPVILCKVYPNPFSDHAIVEIDSDVADGNGVIQLFDMSGKKIRDSRFSGNRTVIEKGDLSPGIYLYEVTFENRSIATGRIVIQ